MTSLRLPLTLASLVLVPLTASVARAEDVPPSVRTAAACAPVGGVGTAKSPTVFALAADDKMPFQRMMYSPGQRVGIDQGTDGGVRPGDRFVVRRPMRFFGAPKAQHTIGFLRIVDATASSATAEVEFACDGVSVGDRLDPYEEVTLPDGVTRTFVGGSLDATKVMRLSYGLEGRGMQGDRDFVLADGAQGAGAAVGDRFTLFHRGAALDPNNAAAEAVVVRLFDDTALLRVTRAREELMAGDQLVSHVGATDPGAEATVARSSAAERLPDPPSRPADTLPANRDNAAADTSAARPAGAQLSFEEVHFGLDRYSLRPEARKVLDDAVKAMQADPGLRLMIEGHTCNIGTAEYNLALGQRRADIVKKYFVSKGIVENRLTTASYGEEKPAHDNSTEEGRRLNRRTALTVNLQR